MGDMGDMYRALKDHQHEERAANLAAADPTGWTRHTPFHWTRTLKGKQLDYWPSRQKWRYEGRNGHGDVAVFIREHEAK